jgi:iron transport multicopper oxidase
VISVTNKLDVPSTMHWHGILQRYTPDMDGAVGVSQCAIPPNYTMVYTFTATPAGTTWYHGHLLEQYTDGLFGPLIVRERNETYQSKYDSEQILMVADWYNLRAHDQLLPFAQHGITPAPDAIVVNGLFTESMVIPVTNTSRIRFRCINSAALSMYNFSIDGCPLHIIEIDQTDVVTYTVNSFVINVAQRVSFYIDLSELDPYYSSSGASPTGSVFIRFQAIKNMYPYDISNYIPPYETQRYPYPTFFHTLYLATLSFDGTNSTPTYQPDQTVPQPANAVPPSDANLLAARPYYPNNVLNATNCLILNMGFALGPNNTFEATINGVPYSSDANYMSMRPDPTTGITSDLYDPVLFQMVEKPNNLSVPDPGLAQGDCTLPVIQSDGYAHYGVPYQAVVDIFINNTDPAEHPFHLHGHKFWVVATSDNPQAETLYAGDYLLRDTVGVPASGWAKIRYYADKPGAWFFHCHIEWHMSVGLALIFVTSPQELLNEGFTISPAQSQMCQALQQFNDSQ